MLVRDEIRSCALLLPARCDRLATLLLPVASTITRPPDPPPAGVFVESKRDQSLDGLCFFRRMEPRATLSPRRPTDPANGWAASDPKRNRSCISWTGGIAGGRSVFLHWHPFSALSRLAYL